MSYENALFQERVVRVECPSAHWTLLRAPNGEFLGVSDDGLAVFDYVDGDSTHYLKVGASAS